MGTKYTFKCNKCGYSVESSGGNDYGYWATIETHICNSCNNLVDILVGEYGKTYSKDYVLKNIANLREGSDFYVCTQCGSKDQLELWDTQRRPCPKCDGLMEINNDGQILLWD